MPKLRDNANSVKSGTLADFPALLNLKEASAVLRVKPRALQHLLFQGRIPGVKIGGEWRLRRDEILALVTSGQVPPSAVKPARHKSKKQNRRIKGVHVSPSTNHVDQHAA